MVLAIGKQRGPNVVVIVLFLLLYLFVVWGGTYLTWRLEETLAAGRRPTGEVSRPTQT